MENLLYNGNFESTDGWTFINQSEIRHGDPSQARNGAGYAKLTPLKSTSSGIIQDVSGLQSGQQYLLSYHVKPMVPTPYVSTMIATIRYLDASETHKLLIENKRIPLVEGRYIERRYVFALPADMANEPVRVSISAPSIYGAPADSHVCVDDVSLSILTDDPFPRYGYYAWIVTGKEAVYTQAGGTIVSHYLNTNDWVYVNEQRIIEGVIWYWIRDFNSKYGWMREADLAWDAPQSQVGKRYVELTEDRVWPRNRDFNRHAYHWPKGRRVLVSNYDETYYRALFNGDYAYIEKSKCRLLSETVKQYNRDRINFIVQGEPSPINIRSLDNHQGEVGQCFLEW